MSIQVQHRRGTTAQHSTFTGAVGEITVDTSKKVPVVHDGTTVGGFPAITEASVSTLSNKGINLNANTLIGTIAQFNTALSDGDFATLAGAETLTNKSVNLSSNTLTGTKAQFNTACSDGDFLYVGDAAVFTLGTPTATTSGTAVDYTGIPATTKRIVVNFEGVSTSGTDPIIVQLGDSGGIETTGYISVVSRVNPGNSNTLTTGLGVIYTLNSSALVYGSLTLTLITGSEWAYTSSVVNSNSGEVHVASGFKSTSATLDRLRITTLNGINSFDAGKVNILYE